MRICPISEVSDIDRARQFNFEFRASDAAASPHLQLAAIVHAGIQGIEEALPVPDATAEDLSLLSGEVLSARGYVRLPQSLAEAVERFAADATVAGWFPAGFADVYVKHKRGEMAFLEGKSSEEVCRLYEEVY